MKKSVEIQSFRANEGKSRTRRNAVATLPKIRKGCEFFTTPAKFLQPYEIFARVANLFATFDFLIYFLFLPNFFPCNSVFFLYILVICIDCGDIQYPKRRLCRRLLPWSRCPRRRVGKILRGGAPSLLWKSCPFLFGVPQCKTPSSHFLFYFIERLF